MNIFEFMRENRYDKKKISKIELNEIIKIIKTDCSDNDIKNFENLCESIENENKVLVKNYYEIFDRL